MKNQNIDLLAEVRQRELNSIESAEQKESRRIFRDLEHFTTTQEHLSAEECETLQTALDVLWNHSTRKVQPKVVLNLAKSGDALASAR